MTYSARERREAMRLLAGVWRRLAAAEDALVEAQAVKKRAETTFDAASDRFAAVELALDAARTNGRAHGRNGTRPGRFTNGRRSP